MDFQPVSERDERLSYEIIGAAMRVHSALGPGLLEAAYSACLAEELRAAGHAVAQEVYLPLEYRGVRVEKAYRIDLLVEDAVVVEVKACTPTPAATIAQVATYLQLSKRRLGLVINFHASSIRDGLKRVVR